MKLTIVPLGLSRGELTLGALECLHSAAWVCLRTAEHDAVPALRDRGIAFEALDELYLRSEDFDSLHDALVRHLHARLDEHGEVAYAVADPLSDATVDALLRALPDGVQIGALPGIGLAGRALCAALPYARGIDLSQVTVVPATDLPRAAYAMSKPLLVTEIASALLAGEAKLALLSVYDAEAPAVYLHGLGETMEIRPLPLSDLDRQASYDHTTALLLLPQPVTERKRYDLFDLNQVMLTLRGPGGCPWDREQTHESLRAALIEEAYEAVEAINDGDPEHLADELGDVLLQVVFHAQIAGQQGEFTLSDVFTAICGKMIQRHEHIFGEKKLDTAREVVENWEAVKRKQRGQSTTAESMRGVAGYLPSLMRAAKIQEKARRVGFDFADAREALPKVREETGELAEEMEGGGNLAEEGGDLLFAVVNVLRLLGVDAELALTAATDMFLRRFEAMEAAILSEKGSLSGMTLAEMDVYWERVKGNLR